MMTTMAADARRLVPLAIGFGEGFPNCGRPLGISIVGGLIRQASCLTLYTPPPVIYLYLDRLRLWGPGAVGWRIRHPRFLFGAAFPRTGESEKSAAKRPNAPCPSRRFGFVRSLDVIIVGGPNFQPVAEAVCGNWLLILGSDRLDKPTAPSVLAGDTASAVGASR